MKPLVHLKELREAAGLSLAELGRRVSLASSTLANYESGRRKPTPDTLARLADILDTSVDYLVDRSDEPTAPSQPDPDPQMAFGASLADGMSYDDLSPAGKAQLIDYFKYLRERYPKEG